MKALVAVVAVAVAAVTLLLASAQAAAQYSSYCPGYPIPVVPPVAVLGDIAPPASAASTPTPTPFYACAPGPSGPGVGLTVRGNAAGVVAWWYCPEGGGYGISFGAATWSRLAGAGLVEKLLKASTAPDAKVALDTFTRENVSTSIGDPTLTPVWCPFWPDMWAGRPRPVPPAAWVVATPTTGTAQRTYTVTAGARCWATGSGPRPAPRAIAMPRGSCEAHRPTAKCRL